jgi:hypothetical protein
VTCKCSHHSILIYEKDCRTCKKVQQRCAEISVFCAALQEEEEKDCAARKLSHFAREMNSMEYGMPCGNSGKNRKKARLRQLIGLTAMYQFEIIVKYILISVK